MCKLEGGRGSLFVITAMEVEASRSVLERRVAGDHRVIDERKRSAANAASPRAAGATRRCTCAPCKLHAYLRAGADGSWALSPSEDEIWLVLSYPHSVRVRAVMFGSA